jgi:glycosyltransferase involved in cell wall biosynthesis
MALESKRVLYISYNGMLDPLGQSQVIPYLKELSKLGVRFWLLSYERAPAFAGAGIESSRRLHDDLSSYGIQWHVLRYHQKPSLPATAFDVAAGVRLGSRLVRENKIEMVHARAHIPAVIALSLKRRFGLKIIFDVRGLMAEEYVEADHWKANGVPARITKAMEARVLRSTDAVVTLTDALWTFMQDWPSLRSRSVVHETIPCCVDLNKFRFDQQQREVLRAELGIADRMVLVYSGSVGGWYMTDEMAAFFSVLRQQNAGAFFLWLTHGSPAIVESAVKKYGIEPKDYAVKKVAPGDVPGYLSAADAGVAFYRPGISRLGTSPVKVSEYLACGLPVVINAGLGDSDNLVLRERVGALVSDFNANAYAQAATTIGDFTAKLDDTRRRTRAVAERLFDLKLVGASRYAQLYERLLAV